MKQGLKFVFDNDVTYYNNLTNRVIPCQNDRLFDPLRIGPKLADNIKLIIRVFQQKKKIIKNNLNWRKLTLKNSEILKVAIG